MKLADTRVNYGGLMRCCLASLSEYIEREAEEEAVEGTIVSCVYGDHGTMILDGGVWRWNSN